MQMKCFSLLKKIFFSLSVLLAAENFVSAGNFYWDLPVAVSAGESQFPETVSNGDVSYAFWQEIDKEKEQIWVSCQRFDRSGRAPVAERFAGPFEYSGSEIPKLYSAALTKTGVLAVAVLSSETQISIFTSKDSGQTFTRSDIPVKKGEFFAPRIYAAKGNRLILFASCAKISNPTLRLHDFYIYQSYSDDGIRWSPLTSCFAEGTMVNSFAPFLESTDSSDYVVFQSRYQQEGITSYQLYFSHSENNCRTWSVPVMITDEKSVDKGMNFYEYDNQGPYLYNFNGNLNLVWERKLSGSENSEIWFEKLNRDGVVPQSAVSVSDKGNSRKANLFAFRGKLYACWFDNRSGRDQSYYSVLEKNDWKTTALTSGSTSSTFPYPVFAAGNLYYIWQETYGSSEKNRILVLPPDTTVAKASVTPDGHKPGRNSRAKRASFRIKMPEDISGIAGYTYSWSQDETAVPEHDESRLEPPSETHLRLNATEEGSWFLKISVLDNAGNWSAFSESSYYLDLTPPGKISFEPLKVDDSGFASSNSFSVAWAQDPKDNDIAGYTYRLTKIAGVSRAFSSTPRHPSRQNAMAVSEYGRTLLELNSRALERSYRLPDTVSTKMPYASWKNLANGLYVLSVSAIDTVGYVGEQADIPILLNKYVPHTVISSIRKNESAFGDVTIEITGTDFLYDGTINEIYIDRDGKKPYDMTITRQTGGYKVSAERITGINIGRDLEEGGYYVGILHSDRGLYMTRRKALQIEANGTVKIENEYEYTPGWKAVRKTYTHAVCIGYAVLCLMLGLSAVGILVFGISFIKNYAELCSTKKIIRQLEQGALMKTDEQTEKEKAQRRNGSLKKSLAGFTISLVILIIAVISLSLAVFMLRNQEQTISKGLHDRVNVLMSSLSTGARTYLPTENNMELSDLLGQMSSLDEAEFLTITGNQSSQAAVPDKTGSLLYVWASNDREVTEKADNLTARKTINPGISKLQNHVESELRIARLAELLNEEAQQRCLELANQIAELNAERTTASRERRNEIDSKTRENNILITNYLQELSEKGSGSVPAFSDKKLDRSVTEYLFYRPVLYRQGTSPNFVHGLVLLQVNTSSLVSEMDSATRNILFIVLIISAVTIAVGILVAEGFASRIVKPIKMLEKTVTEISEENDKERLLAGDITDLPNNEIGRLGDSVNRMKKDLGYNERELNLQANEATPIQQAMVSLEPLSGNFKQNISNISDQKISEFAYYKGAAGASGDYFDFKKLDDRFYVLIKCDASGHAAPAGILVTMVATLYKKYFENWSFEKNGTKLDDFVYKVNDFLESLNIKGKFVAMIICLYDSKTGDVYMCHAGDRLVRIYDSQTHRLNKLELFETPAAGPFPSFMLQMKGGFRVESSNLKQNDIFLLYTDGIEENGRIMRTPDFAAIMKPKVDASGAQIRDEYGNLQFEPEKEEFGEDRVKKIVEAVCAGKKYILTKKDNPAIGEVLEFDFTGCKGTTEECIMALSSIEKLFRLYKPTSGTVKDLVEVDRSIDRFLKEHFSLYDQYAIPPTEESFNGRAVRNPKNPNNVFYAFMKEDVQEDDLTIVALQRK